MTQYREQSKASFVCLVENAERDLGDSALLEMQVPPV